MAIIGEKEIPYKTKKERREYIRDYMKKRYNSDKDFRSKIIEKSKLSQRQNREKWRELGLCIRCGKIIKKERNKKWKNCKKCRKIEKERGRNKTKIFHKKWQKTICGLYTDLKSKRRTATKIEDNWKKVNCKNCLRFKWKKK